MLTKQNYKEIADIIHNTKRYDNSRGVEMIQKSLCGYFKTDNPDFEAEKFNLACKP